MDLFALLKRAALTLLPALAGVAIAAGAVGVQPQQWRATCRVLLGEVAPASAQVDARPARLALQSDAVALATHGESPAFLRSVGMRAGSPPTSGDTGSAVRVSASTDAPIVSVAAVLPDPRAAADLAEAVAGKLAARARTLRLPSAPLRSIVVGGAVVEPVDSPLTTIVPVIGGSAGLLVGVVLIGLLRRRGGRVRTLDDLGDATEAVAFALPRSADASGASSPVDGHGRHRIVAIGAASDAEESWAVALEVAAALAGRGRGVALVDGDLTGRRLSRRLDLAAAPGLSEAVSGRLNVQDAVWSWNPAQQPVAVVAAGTVPARPGALLLSSRLPAVLGLLSDEADLVLVHLPPVLDGPLALMLSSRVDAVVLVARAGITKKRRIQAASLALREAGASVGSALLVEQMYARRGPRRVVSAVRRLVEPVRSLRSRRLPRPARLFGSVRVVRGSRPVLLLIRASQGVLAAAGRGRARPADPRRDDRPTGASRSRPV